VIRTAISVVAVINLLFGVVALIQPARVASWIGFELSGLGAAGEMRAVYGGLVSVVGILMLVAAWTSAGAPLLGPLALLFVGLVIGRIVSLGVDGFAGYTLVATVFEILAAGLLAYAWWRPQGL
jgi:hypothetical protein